MAHREIKLLGSTLACIPRGFIHGVPHLHSRLSPAVPAVSLKGGSCLKEGGYVSFALRPWRWEGLICLWHFPSPSTCALGFHVWLLLIPFRKILFLCWYPEDFPKCKVSTEKPPTKMEFAILNLTVAEWTFGLGWRQRVSAEGGGTNLFFLWAAS